LTVTTIAVSLAALTVGLIPGFARARGVDLLMGGTVAVWALYASVLYLRIQSGRRALSASLALAGFGVVIVLQLGLLATHVA
jgi:hypothetical protein